MFLSSFPVEMNEENFIGKCLDSIITQDHPKDKLEVLVVDGMSGAERIKKADETNYEISWFFHQRLFDFR